MVNASAEDLCAFIDASPSPFHLAATVTERLRAAGFVEVDERDPWPTSPGRFVVVRGGSLIAWSNEASRGPADTFRIVGGHTDSPNLRLKQNVDLERGGLGLLALEPYGGAWTHSWFDRPLGLSGRIALRSGEVRTILVDEPVLVVPQLAIHLAENRKGADPDPQRHVNGIWTTQPSAKGFTAWLAERENLPADAVVGWELMTHDTKPSELMGRERDLVSAPRLDNQVTCHAGIHALLDAVDVATEGVRPVLALFDHEEVGSMSERGAFSTFLATVLERIVLAEGGSADDVHRAFAGSLHASGDMAHASHPNYPERHEPSHQIRLGGGPVLKVNQNLRYATDAVGAAAFAAACDQAGVPLQRYVHRADLPCGSTIGPIAASRTGITTVDVGAPQLAMHSARETMGAADVSLYARALAAFLAPAEE